MIYKWEFIKSAWAFRMLYSIQCWCISNSSTWMCVDVCVHAFSIRTSFPLFRLLSVLLSVLAFIAWVTVNAKMPFRKFDILYLVEPSKRINYALWIKMTTNTQSLWFSPFNIITCVCVLFSQCFFLFVLCVHWELVERAIRLFHL